MSFEAGTTDVDLRRTSAFLRTRAHQALGDSLKQTVPDVSLDSRGYVTWLQNNLIGFDFSEIEHEFSGGAGNELESKMKAPWSSSALVVNSFAPWRHSLDKLSVAGLEGFISLKFEAQCPNGVSRIPPHLDVLLSRRDQVVGIESKCIEFLMMKRAVVSRRYLQLRDERTNSKWFAALTAASNFRLLDAYQLIKHYLGLARTFPDKARTLVYIFWEPINAAKEPVFVEHRRELEQFATLVSADGTCNFVWQSYPELWWQLAALADKPAWFDEHLKLLRARYLIEI